MTTAARTIGLPVGRNGKNSKVDVEVVQTLLNSALDRQPKFRATFLGGSGGGSAGDQKLTVDGVAGPRTVRSIEAFQQAVLGWSGRAVDGTVHPGRRTWKALNGNVASLDGLKLFVEPRAPVDGFVPFRQGDFRETKLGSGTLRVSGYGCALCTLTMAATAIGSPTRYWPEGLRPDALTPPSANDIIRRGGGFVGSLLLMEKAAEALGMWYFEYGMRPGAWSDLLPAEQVSYIESNLLAGNPVAANVDYKSTARPDHWILITKRNGDGTFRAIDPSYGSAMTLTKERPRFAAATTVGRDLEGGVLFGQSLSGSSAQQQYVVKRFALLSAAFSGYCAAI